MKGLRPFNLPAVAVLEGSDKSGLLETTVEVNPGKTRGVKRGFAPLKRNSSPPMKSGGIQGDGVRQ